jgi:hypothetical protein
MIPAEANYAEWFTSAIRLHFLKEGYAFLSFGLTQVDEPGFPAVKLLTPGSRAVGLRFVRPVEGAPGQQVAAYEVDSATRRRMAGAPDGWLLYALPQSADPLDQQLTHMKVLFATDADLEHDPDGHLVPQRTVTFKHLVAALEQAALGRESPAGDTPVAFLSAAREGDATLYLAMNRRERTVIVLGNQWR